MHPTKEQPVYIIILNYNSFDDTVECIKSILENEKQTKYQIILVDNASRKFDTKAIKKLSQDITIIESKTNLGFSGGINLGINKALEADARYILLLNADTVVTKDFLTKLLTTAEENPGSGIVAPLITYYDNPSLIWFRGGSFNRYTSLTGHLNMNKNKKDFHNNAPFETQFISGCCMLIKADVFKKTGLFDESYFLYDEDLDFCYKTTRAGYKLVVNPASEIRHKISASTCDKKNPKCDPHRFTTTKAYYWPRNDLVFIKKNLKGLAKVTAFISIFLIKYPYFIIHLIKKNKLTELKHYFKGILAGLKYTT